MKSQPQIRDCTLDDAAVIAEIYNESIAIGDCTMDDELKTEEDVRRQVGNFSDRETILILEDDEQVLGWGIIKKYSDRLGYRFACETSVYLRRNLVTRGLGTQIKTALIERCKKFGYHHLNAKIFADNEISIQYNKKFGYEIVGRQKEIGFKNGKWQDIVLMQLVLDDV